MERTLILRSFLHQQRTYINHFFDHVNVEDIDKVLARMLACSGTIFFSGIGKSGAVGQKLAKTLISIGIKSFFLDPVEALHGDIGVVNDQDLVIFLSKSGTTKELLQLVPLLKRRNATLISLISSLKSSLAELSDEVIYLPLERELCPHNLAPMTSPSLQMILGDILIAAMMQLKSFSIEDYALNHPAGAIGQKISYFVKDLMVTGDELPLCKPTDPLLHGIIELTNKKKGCLLIIDDESKLLGIFTDGDFRRAVQRDSQQAFMMSMESLMNPEYLSIGENALALDAINLMQKDPERRVMMLPVVENSSLKGLICMHDIIQAGLRTTVLEI